MAEVGPVCKLAAQEALKVVGVAEDPTTPNSSKFIDLYNKRAGVPIGSFWCASFVYYRITEALSAINKDRVKGEKLSLPEGFPSAKRGAASVDAYVRWAKENGHWHPSHGDDKPEVGDLVCYDLPGDNTSVCHHIGIVVEGAEPGDAEFTTVEGNTRDKGDPIRNGYKVAKKKIVLSSLGTNGGWIRVGI